MRFERDFLEGIKERLPIDRVAQQLGIKLTRAGREFKALSPFNPEKSPSFYVIPAKRMFHCFSSGKTGNVFDLVMELRGLRFPDAVEECARDAGVSMPAGWRSGPIRPDHEAEARKAAERARMELERKKRESDDARKGDWIRAKAYDVWKAAVPVPGTLAETYLRTRGIYFGPMPSLRFHPSCPYDVDGQGLRLFPALLGVAQHPTDDRFVSLWRICLKDDGSGKREGVSADKAGLGRLDRTGCAVRIGPVTEVANVCEGIETGLGIFGLLGQKQGVQAALSTSGMVNFIPPKGCSRVLIWPDGDTNRAMIDRTTGEIVSIDSPGHRSANILLERLRSEGIRAAIQPIPRGSQNSPKASFDFLDIWQSIREDMHEFG